jgi:16S rRNA (uracil1498-N3)-methyltransferase
MPQERFFYPKALVVGETVSLDEEETRHVKVMRPRIGDELELINGQGFLAKAVLLSLEKKDCAFAVKSVFYEEPAKEKLILAQGLPRQNRLDFIVEKSTELGIAELWLFDGERSEKKGLSSQQHQRIELQFIAAMKQSGRLFLPTLRYLPAISNCIKEEGSLWLFGDLSIDAPRLLEAIPKEKVGAIVAFIGPEAGFSSQEIDWLRNHEALGVRLSSNILRTDTAAIAMLALLGAVISAK